MFDYLSGILARKTPICAVVECSGVGYLLHISLQTYESLPAEGDSVKLFTHLVHRDDDMELYGFASLDEREFFRKLIGVTRVGPKLALSIMSGMNSKKLASAIAAGDVATLSKIPKVGKKTAERIILELKGKVEMPLDFIDEDEGLSDAVAALVGLGFSRTEAVESISRAKKSAPDGDANTLVKIALQKAVIKQ